MSEEPLVVDVCVLDRLLADIVDTREKLDIVVCLRRSHGTLTIVTISAHTGLPWVGVAEALRDLHRAGIVATSNEDGAGWWLDDCSPWLDVTGVLARMYELDRRLLLRRMTSVALHRLRAAKRTDVPQAIRLRFKHEP